MLPGQLDIAVGSSCVASLAQAVQAIARDPRAVVVVAGTDVGTGSRSAAVDSHEVRRRPDAARAAAAGWGAGAVVASRATRSTAAMLTLRGSDR